ncbi:MAG: FkbM family methyltransferase [Microcystis sp. M54BS1]|uniref:FkbM family methyltransferase n=1 Tax=unclassified Microcystis TaxID=2643300 RepID=UPI002579E976|nr:MULTISPECIES: FkbM family methyltransferase [unclassified Microcystis]MCA2540286.1 FkbM family methyltransferase [Microcystis sp. M54BS1]MCA2597010.1 FkbM family methyltransferase [Microcystis sp. M38BS1]MCA2609144.1 FkbM family methyltransferase [Microcystis sp. M27BS1]MCA2505025.1 FkbM family methyltransferase [Microcystis sp. M62BS1]MCA2511369.1 FkbM family methyltransferase [Microcystis sp. M60BS1]
MMKQLLAKNKIVQRFKAVKDLFLEKLDSLSHVQLEQIQKLEKLEKLNQLDPLDFKVEQLNNSTEQLRQENAETKRKADLLLENQAFLLKFSVDLVQGIQQFNQDSQQQQQAIYQAIEKIYQDSQQQQQAIYQAIEKIYQDSQQQQQAIYQTFQAFQEETRERFQLNQQVLSKVYEYIHNYKFKVVTNQSNFQGIEVELMCYLYSYLPYPSALDIGANQGDVTERLLQTGYEVYAFEPFLPVVEKLKNRLSNFSNLHVFPLALGAINEERELHLVGDQNLVNDPNSQPLYPDADYTLLSSINIHSLPEGMVFTETVPITVTTLETLHQQQQVPSEVGLVKIDTEGFDLQVIQGMGDWRYPVVVAEFWDEKFPFGEFGVDNRLPSLVEAMKLRGYHWFIVIYRVFPNNEVSFYCNHLISVGSSWGNIFFFQEHSIFSEALKWCSCVMPATYFSNAY